jgi:hypothetical protein
MVRIKQVARKAQEDRGFATKRPPNSVVHKRRPETAPPFGRVKRQQMEQVADFEDSTSSTYYGEAWEEEAEEEFGVDSWGSTVADLMEAKRCLFLRHLKENADRLERQRQEQQVGRAEGEHCGLITMGNIVTLTPPRGSRI